MNWSGIAVLVTGAGGFVGSHLVEELARRGARVRAFLRYTSRADRGLLELLPEALLPSIEIQRGDLRDGSAVFQAMEGCELVVHLGALISIPYSYRHPAEVVETNVIGTLNVLESARRARVRRVICISSSEVYGTAQSVPMTEGHPLRAQSPYAASKIGADQLALSYHRSFDLPVAVVRPFNVYGPRQSARAVIPAIITQALTRERIHIGSLHPRRDFTFVRDTVDGLLLAAATEQAVGREINLGSDDEISIGELAKKITDLIGRPLSIEHDEDRRRPAASEVDRLHADNTVARTVLGWRPTVRLEDGLRETIAWIEKHLARYPMEYRVY